MSVTLNIEATGANKAISEVQRVEKALNKLGDSAMKSSGGTVSGGRMAAGGGKQKNTGFAFLAASQAFEDFSMAGVKGVLNNIPQMLMFSGVGAGMAATISVLGVAAYIAGPKLFRMSSDFEAMTKAMDNAAKAASDAEAMTSSLQKLKDSVSDMNFKNMLQDSDTAFSSVMEAIADSLKSPRDEMEKLVESQQDLFDSNERIIKQKQKYDDMFVTKGNEGSVSAQRDIEEAQRKLEFLQRQQKMAEEARQKLIASNPGRLNSGSRANSQEEMIFIKTQIDRAEAEKKAIEAEIEKKKKNVEAFTGVKGFINDSLNEYFRADPQKFRELAQNELADTEKSLQANKDKTSQLKQQLEAAQKAEELRVKGAQKDEENAKLYDAELNALDEKRSKLTQIQAELEKELQIKKMILEAEALKKAEERKEFFRERLTTGSEFLSSQARVGLGAAQSRNALGVVNYQRQANQYLKTIAQNTAQLGGKMPATYGK